MTSGGNKLAAVEPLKTLCLEDLCEMARKSALFALMLEQLGYGDAAREVEHAKSTWPEIDFDLGTIGKRYLEPGERLDYNLASPVNHAKLVHRVICEGAVVHVFRVRGWDVRSDRQVQGITKTPPLFELLRPGEQLELAVENPGTERIKLEGNLRVQGYVIEGQWE